MWTEGISRFGICPYRVNLYERFVSQRDDSEEVNIHLNTTIRIGSPPYDHNIHVT